MTFWSLTNSDFQPNQTFHRFHDLDTELDLHRLWVVSMEHLELVWHASRERLLFRTPGSVLHYGTCLCSNCWDQIPRTCHVFTRLFTSNTPWYFLDFALMKNLYMNISPNTSQMFNKRNSLFHTRLHMQLTYKLRWELRSNCCKSWCWYLLLYKTPQHCSDRCNSKNKWMMKLKCTDCLEKCNDSLGEFVMTARLIIVYILLLCLINNNNVCD